MVLCHSRSSPLHQPSGGVHFSTKSAIFFAVVGVACAASQKWLVSTKSFIPSISNTLNHVPLGISTSGILWPFRRLSLKHTLMIFTLKKCPLKWANWKQGCLPWQLRVYSATSSQWRSAVKVTVVSIKGTHLDRCGTCAICRTSTASHQYQLPKR